MDLRFNRSSSKRTRNRYSRKNAKTKNKKVVRIVEKIKKTRSKLLRGNE